MSKRLLWALLLIALTVVVLIGTKGQTSVELIAFDVKAATSMVLLAFTAVGVAIGFLLK